MLHDTYPHRSDCTFLGPWTPLTNLPHPEISLPGFSGDLPLKVRFWILFLSAVQGVLSYSIFRYKEKTHLGFLINKTVGPRHSLLCLPPGISMSQLSAMMVCRYLDSDGYVSLGYLYLLCTSTSLFLFSGVGRTFCSIWRSCQTCQSKSLIFPAHHAKHILLCLLRCQSKTASLFLAKLYRLEKPKGRFFFFYVAYFIS